MLEKRILIRIRGKSRQVFVLMLIVIFISIASMFYFHTKGYDDAPEIKYNVETPSKQSGASTNIIDKTQSYFDLKEIKKEYEELSSKETLTDEDKKRIKELNNQLNTILNER